MFPLRLLAIVATVAFEAILGQFVAADGVDGQRKDPAASSTVNMGGLFLNQAIERVPKLSALVRSFQASTTGVDDIADFESAPVVWVRMSDTYLANYFQTEVDYEKPAFDRILGINFTGTSRTSGDTHLILKPSTDGAAAEVEFEGRITSRVIGQERSAKLHYVAESTFRARKAIALTDREFTTSPAQAEALTHLTPIKISTSSTGLRGCLVQRIAWRRAAANQAKADAIASQHRARDIQVGLDHRLDETLASIEDQDEERVAHLLRGSGNLVVRSRSTAHHVEFALVAADQNSRDFRMPEFDVVGEPDVAVRVRRAAIARVIADPIAGEELLPLIARLAQVPNIGAKIGDQSTAPVQVDARWYALDLSKADLAKIESHVAAKTVAERDVR